MSAKPSTIACVGLPGHERTMVRLVTEVEAQNLERPWRYGSPDRADVVFLDPAADQLDGHAVSPVTRPALVAVINADAPTATQTPLGRPALTLRRPIDSEAIRQTLQTVDQRAARHPAYTEGGAQEADKALSPAPLGLALHEAMVEGATRTSWRLTFTDNENHVLILHPGRDQLRGAVKRLGAEPLHGGATVTRARIASETANDDSAIGTDRSNTLYALLWGLGYRTEPALPLFGDPQRATIHLRFWPRIGELDLDREELRALTRLFRRSYHIGDAARATGLKEEALIALMNGAWLAGDLAVDASTPSDRSTRRPAAKVTPKLIDRIRNRMARAS